MSIAVSETVHDEHTGSIKTDQKLYDSVENVAILPVDKHETSKLDDKKQIKLETLEEGVKGKVKWYNVCLHYGFIKRLDGVEKDVFVHQSAILKSRIIKPYLRTLGDGENVEFDVVQGKKGPEAANVTGPNGCEVRGSRYHNFQFFGFRRNFYMALRNWHPFRGNYYSNRKDSRRDDSRESGDIEKRDYNRQDASNNEKNYDDEKMRMNSNNTKGDGSGKPRRGYRSKKYYPRRTERKSEIRAKDEKHTEVKLDEV